MIALVGFGAHGSDCLAIYERVHGPASLELFDDNPSAYVLPSPEEFPFDTKVIYGIYSPEGRRKFEDRWPKLEGADPLVDPSAIVGPEVKLSEGVVIAPHAVLLHTVTIGKHTHLNYGCSMTRCTIGAFTTISPAVTICGSVFIGDDCFVGAGATICDRVSIGNNVTVAAGAIVPPQSRVPNGSKVVGVWKP